MIEKWCFSKTENIVHRNSMYFIFYFSTKYSILITQCYIINPTVPVFATTAVKRDLLILRALLFLGDLMFHPHMIFCGITVCIPL